jgi:hypothetical protein
MSDQEKFAGLKRKMVDENEKQYGQEIREKYGDEMVDASNAKVMNMTPEQMERVQGLSCQINESLAAACAAGNPASELAQKVCQMHKEWLGYFWKHYSPEAHLGLAQMYVDDPRFKKYYDAHGEGCAEFLRDALSIFCS